MKTYIYTLEHSETGEIRYVGKTTNTKRRYYQHTSKKVCKKLSNKHLGNWLLSILNKDLKPILRIIEECEDNWVESEVYWIEQFKVWGFNLVNFTKGGEGFGHKHSEESKKKMSLAQKGVSKNFTEETLKAKKENFTANNPMKDEEIKNKVLSSPNHHFYNPRLESIKKSLESRKKLLENGFRFRTRKVINTETNEIFNTIKEAAESIGITRTHLTLCLSGKRKNLTKFEYYEQ
jgi:group I intron endonuclease